MPYKTAFAPSLPRVAATTILALRDTGSSLRTIAAELTSQGIVTARGGAWTAAAVRAVLLQIAA